MAVRKKMVQLSAIEESRKNFRTQKGWEESNVQKQLLNHHKHI